VQVDLLLPERERRPRVVEGHDAHPEDARVEGTGTPNVLDRQHQVVKVIDLHGGAPSSVRVSGERGWATHL